MKRKCLIDADVLRYEVGSVGQKYDKDTGEYDIRGWDFVLNVFDERIRTICDGAGGDNDPILFLTGDRTTHRIYSKSRSRTDDFVVPTFAPNFREALANGKVYKGTRKQDKPFHWINLTAHILSQPSVVVAVGCEADDLVAIHHTLNPDGSIICTRDKDLRMVPGWHYGWECGKQPELGPVKYDDLGEIRLVQTKSGNKIVGGGFAFFCSQLLTGDVVDNIGGLKGYGPVKTFKLLENCTSMGDYFSAVRNAYHELVPDNPEEALREQCNLLWIVRELNPDGSLKMFGEYEWLNT